MIKAILKFFNASGHDVDVSPATPLPVSPIGVSGAEASYVMSALAVPTYAVPQIIESNFAAKRVVFGTLQAIVASQPLLIGWSTSSNAGGAIGAVLDLLATELVTPGTDTPVAYQNTKVIRTDAELAAFVLEWDGSDTATTIKSLAARSITTGYTVALETLQ